MAYELVYGPIPDGLFGCHRCDNPGCVRPDHIFLGTNAENTADMVAKGRNKLPPRMRGEAHPFMKLSDAAVRIIRASSEAGVILAKRYAVSPSTISNIRNGLAREHVQ
jgi:hypothetical protein